MCRGQAARKGETGEAAGGSRGLRASAVEPGNGRGGRAGDRHRAAPRAAMQARRAKSIPGAEAADARGRWA